MRVATLLLLPLCQAILRPHFQKFVSEKFGDKALKSLNRADIGKGIAGSFGGGNPEPSNRRPVVFVHGLRMKAGHLAAHRQWFTRNGWPLGRLVATTYGPGKVGLLDALQESMHCEYVKQVRNLLEATIDYFKSDIDVIGYSMGSPISRKAIMGGHCVDTGEYIGESLNDRIQTFVGVAGANYGSYLCQVASPGFCSEQIGLKCNSAFLNDINNGGFLVGKHRYALASNSDEVVGFYNQCGQKVHDFPGSTEIILPGRSHMGIILKAIQEQFALIRQHA